jgi:hypothetical protein
VNNGERKLITYILTKGWVNPTPDRREKYDWKMFPELKEGAIFIGSHHPNPVAKVLREHGVDAPDTVVMVRPMGMSGSAIRLDEADKLGLPLEPVEPSTLSPFQAALALVSDYRWRDDAYLEAMVMAFGFDRVEKALSAFSQLPEKD